MNFMQTYMSKDIRFCKEETISEGGNCDTKCIYYVVLQITNDRTIVCLDIYNLL